MATQKPQYWLAVPSANPNNAKPIVDSAKTQAPIAAATGTATGNH